MTQHLGHHRSRLLALALVASLWGCLGLPPAPAQSNDSTYYTNSSVLSIPFQLDEGGGRIQQLLLHVSEDQGKSYQQVAIAHPSDRGFTFNAKRDGWYWFILQTQDGQGQLNPASVNIAQPGLKVCVDTTKPKVATFKPVVPQEGTVAVEWAVSDENLDRLSLQLDYRPANGGGPWTPLNFEKLTHGQLGWAPPFSGGCEVRLRVADKARNTVEATTTATPTTVGRPTNTGGAEGKRSLVRHVRTRQVQLRYSIGNKGPSDVKNVEVWETRDARSWRRYADDAPPNGPYTVTVKGEGLYGFTLVPRSGVGLARPAPAVGEQPRVWVEVDETRPAVNLHRVDVGRGPDAGKMAIYWAATDRHLQARPISILYATTPAGPWTALPGAAKLENVSPYTASCEGLPFELYLRVEAIDEAGNVGFSVYREAVKVDLKVPEVHELDVQGVSGGGEAPPLPRAPGGPSPP